MNELRRKVFTLAWQFVKRNGMSLSQALKRAWTNVKLHAKMLNGIVKFYYQKVDGTLREAYGTLQTSKIPAGVAGEGESRKKNDTLQTYFDTEVREWRCFKIANLVKIG